MNLKGTKLLLHLDRLILLFLKEYENVDSALQHVRLKFISFTHPQLQL